MIIAVDSDLFISEITDLLFDAFILAAGPMLTFVPLNNIVRFKCNLLFTVLQ